VAWLVHADLTAARQRDLHQHAPRLLVEVAEMKAKNVECSDLHQQPWGMLVQITLPGGGKLGVYQPRHARPPAMT